MVPDMWWVGRKVRGVGGSGGFGGKQFMLFSGCSVLSGIVRSSV